MTHPWHWAWRRLRDGGSIRRSTWAPDVYAALAPNYTVETRRVGELDPISVVTMHDFLAANVRGADDWEYAEHVLREIE